MATKAKFKITTTTVTPIVNNFCLSTDFKTNVTPKVGNITWQNLVNALQPIKSFTPLDGSRTQHLTYKDSGANCYNIVAELEAKRVPPQTIAQINNGVCNRAYGYGFFQDCLGFLPKLTPKPKITVAINNVEPFLRGTLAAPNYTSTFSQIDLVISLCAKAGIEIECWQIGDESGTIDDVFKTSQSIFDSTQTIANYINGKGKYKISGDPNLVDDATMRLKDLNAKLNTLVGVDYMRQYFHIYDNNYADGRIRIAGFQAFCDLFKQQMPSKKMRIEQQQVVPATTSPGNPNPIPNPLKNTVGEGLLYCEELISVIKNGTIEDYHMDVGRLIDSDTSALRTPYQMIKLFRGAQQNDGMVTIELVDPPPGAENLVLLAVKKGSGAEIYCVNPTPTDYLFESVKTDTFKKKVNVESYYGAPMQTTPATPYTELNSWTFTIKGNCAAKVSTI